MDRPTISGDLPVGARIPLAHPRPGLDLLEGARRIRRGNGPEGIEDAAEGAARERFLRKGKRNHPPGMSRPCDSAGRKAPAQDSHRVGRALQSWSASLEPWPGPAGSSCGTAGASASSTPPAARRCNGESKAGARWTPPRVPARSRRLTHLAPIHRKIGRPNPAQVELSPKDPTCRDRRVVDALGVWNLLVRGSV